jgi:hypothetical protein
MELQPELVHLCSCCIELLLLGARGGLDSWLAGKSNILVAIEGWSWRPPATHPTMNAAEWH